MKKLFGDVRCGITFILILVIFTSCAPHGERKEFYPNGNLKRVEYWKHGVRHGTFIDYYENGRRWQEIPYVNGKVSGISITYAEDGDTLATVQSQDSRQHGWSKAFHDGNKIAAMVRFVDGFEEGEDVSYYENGQVKHKGQNHLGVRTGAWYYYSETGKPLKVEHWKEGRLQGVDSASVNFGGR